MFSALLKFRRRPAKRSDSPAMPYRVECGCGKVLNGTRGEKALAIRCSGCGSAILIFPSSPLALLRQSIREALHSSVAKREAPKVEPSAQWRRPLLAAGITAATLVAGFIILLNTVFRSDDSSSTANAESQAREEEIAGRRALADAAFAEAAQHFRKARTHLTKDEDTRRLEQLEKESALMADLLSESLTEHLQRAKGLSDKAWKDLFRERLLDKTVIFDDIVHSAGGGVYRIEYPAYVSGHSMRVEIRNSAFLKSLKAQWPARLLIGLRLQDAKREGNGNWVVLANPDNVVLLTEPAMFSNSSVALDADMEKILRDQAALIGLGP